MNPNIDLKAAAEKQLRVLERERNVLRRIQWSAPLLPLEHPYPRGWERWFEWTPEARLRAPLDHSPPRRHAGGGIAPRRD